MNTRAISGAPEIYLSPMDLRWSLLIGGVAGWLAGRIMNSTGNSVLLNIVLGLIGGVVGSFAFAQVGLSADNTLGRIIMATVGAIILIVLVRAIRK